MIGSSTNAERRSRLQEFGAHLTVDTSDPAWVQQVRDATGGQGVDVVVDQVTGSLASQTLHATKVLGRIVNVGRLGGNQAEFDFDIHARRRITFRRRHVPHAHEGRSARDHAEDAGGPWILIEAGELRLPISHTFAFAELNAALRR